MSLALVGLGSNLGDRAHTLAQAVAQLRATPGVQVIDCSRWHESAPAGGPAGQQPFLNGAALLSVDLQPRALLATLHQIEASAGRVRDERWGPRTLDLDLLLFGDEQIDTADLVVPHPRFAVRKFAVVPAAEIAADLVHPTIGWTVGQLRDHLEQSVAYVAITGPICVGKTSLARQIARKTGARLIEEPFAEVRLAEFYADPPGTAWDTELEFLDLRERLLSSANWRAAGDWVVSDFHFAQSLAFATLWLDKEKLTEFEHRWRRAQATVQPPRLTVVLNAPTDMLLKRIAVRGRLYEQGINAEWIDRLQPAMRQPETMPLTGPVLRLSGVDLAAARVETLAAMASSS